MRAPRRPPRTEVRVREALPGDFEAIPSLWREADALHARLLPDTFREPGVGSMRELFDRYRRRRSETLLVAEASGAVVGFTALHLAETPGDPSLQPGLRAHVEVLAVAGPARRQGVGRALMVAAEEWAREQGARELSLTVWEGNRDAELFYRALSFEPMARVLRRRLRE